MQDTSRPSSSPNKYSPATNDRVESNAETGRISILTSYGEGGAGIAAGRLFDGLRKVGRETELVSIFDVSGRPYREIGYTREGWALLEAVTVYTGEVNRLPTSTAFSPSYPSLTFEQLAFLRNTDVINLHWVTSMLSTEAVQYLGSLGKPIVWTLHDMNPFTGGCHYTGGCGGFRNDCSACPQIKRNFNNFPSSTLNRKIKLYPNNMVVVTPSNWLAEEARSSPVFRNHRIEVIPYGVDTETFTPVERLEARRILGLPAHDKIVLFSSTNHRETRKGFSYFLECCERIQKRIPGLHALTMGHCEGLDAFPIPHSSLGHINDDTKLALCYSAADVTVIPSLEDNLPNTILESSACGTPVVAFDSGGIRDAVFEGINGFLVSKGEFALLSERVLDAFDSDLRSSSRALMLERFPLELQAERYGQLFDSLVKEPKQKDVKYQPVSEIEPNAVEPLFQMMMEKSGEQLEQIYRLKEQLETLIGEASRSAALEADHSILSKSLHRCKQDLDALRNSFSWRMTSPLRVFKKTFNSLKRYSKSN